MQTRPVLFIRLPQFGGALTKGTKVCTTDSVFKLGGLIPHSQRLSLCAVFTYRQQALRTLDKHTDKWFSRGIGMEGFSPHTQTWIHSGYKPYQTWQTNHDGTLVTSSHDSKKHKLCFYLLPSFSCLFYHTFIKGGSLVKIETCDGRVLLLEPHVAF